MLTLLCATRFFRQRKISSDVRNAIADVTVSPMNGDCRGFECAMALLLCQIKCSPAYKRRNSRERSLPAV